MWRALVLTNDQKLKQQLVLLVHASHAHIHASYTYTLFHACSLSFTFIIYFIPLKKLNDIFTDSSVFFHVKLFKLNLYKTSQPNKFFPFDIK